VLRSLAVLLLTSAIAAACNLSANSGDPVAPRFSEEAATAGLTHRYDGDFEYFVGGGVAAFDCDDNLVPELFIAGGTQPAQLFVNRSSAGGALAFEAKASAVTDLDAVTGAYPIDIDSDGVSDLVVLRNGENVLLRGLGGCQFERANETWNFDGGNDWNTAFTARWDEGANFPTVAIGRYLGTTDPNEYFCADNELIQPAGAAVGFSPSVPLTPGWCTLSMLFSDWNRSGNRDLRISNDLHYYGVDSDGQEQLWRVDKTGNATEYTADDGWKTLRIWGMGIASYDVTGDGMPEYYLTSQGDNKLQSLANGFAIPTYEDIALEMNATAHRPYEGDTTKPSTAWHDDFQDFNNDGLMDLFVTKGNVEAMPEYAEQDPNNLLLGKADGTFVESAEAAGLVDYARSRGAAVTDLNADGLLDMVVVTRRENVRLWRNVGPGQKWLQLKVTQDGVNTNGVGAWIEVTAGDRTQRREITVGGGHVSGVLAPIHFGLGDAQNARVRVTWPDGGQGPEISVEANALYEIARDSGEAVKLR
jgi:hypothetical protein